jgi:hypothetical protein
MRLAVSDRAEAPVKATKHPGNGFYYVSGTLTRPGIFRYETTDGSFINAVRLPEEVHSPEFLATVNGSAFMLDHPAKVLVEPGDPIDGMVVKAVVDDNGAVNIEGWLTSSVGIAAVDNGIRQLSACFVPDWVDMSKVEIFNARTMFPNDAKACHDGRWMFHQNLINNHAAIVDVGRVSGAALDSSLFIKETNMATAEEVQEILAIVEDEMPLTGGEVSLAVEETCDMTAEDVENSDTAQEMMSMAQSIIRAAMAMAKTAVNHGMKMTPEDVASDQAAAADSVIKHFQVTVPAAIDSASGRIALATALLSQPAPVADEVEAVVETPVVAADSATVKPAESIHDIYDRIAAAANKA